MHCYQAHYIRNMDGENDDDASSLSSASPDPNHNSDDDASSWPSLYSYHSRCHCHGLSLKDSPCQVYIPWVREWLQQEPEVIFVGSSLSILNGGIFNHDDISIEFRSILEGEYELASSCGRDWVSFSHISVILDQNPYGHAFTLLLAERHMLLRTDEDTGEYMDTDGSLADGHSSDEDYSLLADE